MGLISAVVDTAKNLVCTSLKLNETLAGRVAGLLFGQDSVVTREFVQWYNLSRICDPPPPPSLDTLNRDQLCPCVQYSFDVVANWVRPDGSPQSQLYEGRLGFAPITVFWDIGNEFSPGATGATLRYNSATLSSCPDIVLGLTDIENDSIRTGTTPSFSILRMEPVTPLPNGCEYPFPPPPPPPPYDPDDFTYDVDVPYTDDDNGNVYVVPIVFIIGQVQFNANLDLTIPVTINLKPQLNFTFNVPISFQIEFNLNTGDTKVYPPTPPGQDPPRLPPPPRFDPDFDPDVPPPPPPPDDIPDPDPPPPDEPPVPRVIVGAIVTVSEPQSALGVGQLGQSPNPDVYYPDLGLVSFRIRHPNGSGWTEDIRIKNARQFVPCPWGGGAVQVSGTARGSATMVVSPVYGYPEERLLR